MMGWSGMSIAERQLAVAVATTIIVAVVLYAAIAMFPTAFVQPVNGDTDSVVQNYRIGDELYRSESFYWIKYTGYSSAYANANMLYNIHFAYEARNGMSTDCWLVFISSGSPTQYQFNEFNITIYGVDRDGLKCIIER